MSRVPPAYRRIETSVSPPHKTDPRLALGEKGGAQGTRVGRRHFTGVELLAQLRSHPGDQVGQVGICADSVPP